MKRRLALLAALVTCTSAPACELPRGGQEIASRDGNITLSYRPDPSGLAIDRQFSVIVHVCAKVPVDSLSVDARMPLHRHGMNYKPSMILTPSGAWRADGLLLHMPGNWEFLFGVRVKGKTERLTHTVQVR